jgi:hypothetical protein
VVLRDFVCIVGKNWFAGSDVSIQQYQLSRKINNKKLHKIPFMKKRKHFPPQITDKSKKFPKDP